MNVFMRENNTNKGFRVGTILFLPEAEQEEKEMFTFPTIDMVKTGQNIIVLRKLAGLSVRDLQDAFGFGTPQAIYKWQQGLALPTIDNLVVLAALLGVTIDDVIVTDKKNQIQLGA